MTWVWLVAAASHHVPTSVQSSPPSLLTRPQAARRAARRHVVAAQADAQAAVWRPGLARAPRARRHRGGRRGPARGVWRVGRGRQRGAGTRHHAAGPHVQRPAQLRGPAQPRAGQARARHHAVQAGAGGAAARVGRRRVGACAAGGRMGLGQERGAHLAAAAWAWAAALQTTRKLAAHARLGPPPPTHSPPQRDSSLRAGGAALAVLAADPLTGPGSPASPAPAGAPLSAGALAEMRSRLIAGLKRYFHAKRMEGLLSVRVSWRRGGGGGCVLGCAAARQPLHWARGGAAVHMRAGAVAVGAAACVHCWRASLSTGSQPRCSCSPAPPPAGPAHPGVRVRPRQRARGAAAGHVAAAAEGGAGAAGGPASAPAPCACRAALQLGRRRAPPTCGSPPGPARRPAADQPALLRSALLRLLCHAGQPGHARHRALPAVAGTLLALGAALAAGLHLLARQEHVGWVGCRPAPPSSLPRLLPVGGGQCCQHSCSHWQLTPG